ncbi:MAG: immunoglobulin domain-containing protein [Verrucomicrobiota bacterium]
MTTLRLAQCGRWCLARPALALLAGLLLISAGCSVFTTTATRNAPHVQFLKQPEDQCAWVGGDAAFIVQVTPPEATFQWYKNGVVITNATNSLLVIVGVKFSDVGLYSCTATASPAVSSRSASLSVAGTTSTTGGVTTVPVSAPYVSNGTSTTGPCGSYFGVVKFPRPNTSPLVYSWQPPVGTTSARFSDTTTSIAGYSSTACMLQNSPVRRTCSAGQPSVTASVNPATTYQFSIYVISPSSLASGTPVNGTIEWIR